MSELGRQLFLTSLNQYERSIRWAFLLIIIAVVVHATIFSRAVKIQKELHVNRSALDRLSSMHQTAERLPKRIASFNESVSEQKGRVDKVTSEWFRNLKLRIDHMNAILEPGYRGVNISGERSSISPASGHQVQGSFSQGDAKNAFKIREELRHDVEEAKLDKKLSHAGSHPERFRIVVSFVNEHIIPKSFKMLNERWKTSDALMEEAKNLKGTIKSVEPPTEDSVLKRALRPVQYEVLTEKTRSLAKWRSKVDSFRKVMKSIHFEPPEEERWWTTVAGKGEEQVNMAGNVKETVQQAGHLQLKESEMAKVVEELKRSAKRQEEATKSLKKELEQLESQLQKGTSKLGGMGTGWLPIGGSIGEFVQHFPLLLGVLLAVVVGWPTYRRFSLVRSMRLLLHDDAEEEPRRLLWEKFGVPDTTLGWPLLVGAILGFLWIGYGAVTAAHSPLVSVQGAVTSGLGGATALAAALAYRVTTVRRMQTLVPAAEAREE
jgi:hypothetical protein